MEMEGNPALAAIVMASGFSRRMGRNKLLLPLEGGTVIGKVLEQIGKIGYDAVAVVSGDEGILAEASARSFFPVMNGAAAEGKSSSIRAGISALLALAKEGRIRPPGGAVFFTGDQILLSDALLKELTDTFRRHPERVIFPTYDGNPGSPGTFPMDMAARLMELRGEEGGMRAAKEQKDRILLVPASPGWQGMDIDTEEAWTEVRRRRAALRAENG